MIGACIGCGTEIIYGASATRLEVELRLCCACPTEAYRAALLEGLDLGTRAGLGEDVASAWGPSPFDINSPEYRWRKRGWWAGLWSQEPEERHRRARLALDVMFFRSLRGAA